MYSTSKQQKGEVVMLNALKRMLGMDYTVRVIAFHVGFGRMEEFTIGKVELGEWTKRMKGEYEIVNEMRV